MFSVLIGYFNQKLMPVLIVRLITINNNAEIMILCVLIVGSILLVY